MISSCLSISELAYLGSIAVTAVIFFVVGGEINHVLRVH